MITFSDPYLYAKGTCNVIVSDPATGDIDYQSSKVQTNQLTTSVDTGAIRAGLGNGIAIQLASDATVDLSLTAADFNLDGRGLQVGSTPFYSAPAPTCESITATGATLTISGTAVAPQGYSKKLAYVTEVGASNPIGTAGQAYTIGDGGVVTGFAATSGKSYLVYYWVQNANARQLTIYSAFAPAVKHVTAQIAVYSTEGSNAGNRGSQVGWLYYIIPRMQFSGNAATSGDQTAAATTELSGTALTYEAAVATGVCADCATPELAYMVYVPFDATEGILGLAVVGGAVSLVKSTSAQIPVKLYMADGTLVQPDFSALTFTAVSAPTGTTVGAHTGVISAGSTTGDFDVNVKLTADESIATVVAVSVTNS